ncbi:MAG: DEAD/DEAH box helicase, partial [Phycisphaerae bacterium]|nr:DEAD/DEAH box helicase [Phycisphaerae bacterium]
AIQISQEINELARFTPIRATTIYGGQAIRQQAKNLSQASQIIVGTPGRIMDMHERRMLNFSQTRFVVLDEVDRMLDIGFREDIRRILDLCPPIERRQTVMVSATISVEIEKLGRRYMREPEKIVTSSGSLTVSLVEQHYLAVQPWDKRRLLLHLVKHEEPALTIVFCRLKRTVDELAKYLADHGVGAHAMHGDMRQGKRNQVMEALKGGTLEVLIASDLASRGIDAEGVSHVINYDLPDDPDLYVHRIGRTARAGRGGIAWSLVTPAQGELLTQIENLINAEIPKMEYPDFVASPKPERWRDVDAGGRPVMVIETGDKTPKLSRMATAAAKDVPPPEQVDTTKFPGGIVPTKLPPKRLFGKLPGRGR